jgi:hypothetical protein
MADTAAGQRRELARAETWNPTSSSWKSGSPAAAGPRVQRGASSAMFLCPATTMGRLGTAHGGSLPGRAYHPRCVRRDTARCVARTRARGRLRASRLRQAHRRGRLRDRARERSASRRASAAPHDTRGRLVESGLSDRVRGLRGDPDRPDNRVRNAVEGSVDVLTATTFGYEQSAGGPCWADSGGPAITVSGEEARVAGVTSYGVGDCWTRGVSRASSAARFVQQYVDGAELCAAR